MTESRICHAHRLNSLASVLLLSAAFGLETSGPQGWRWPMKPWFRMGFGRRLMRVVPMTDSGFPAEEVTRVRPRRREGRSPQSMKPCVRKAGPVEPMGETRPWKVVFAYRRSRWIRKPMKGWRRGAAMMLFGMGAQSTSCRLCWPCTPKKHPPVCGTPNACARCQLRRTRARFSDEGAGFGSGLGQSGLGARAIRAVDVASATPTEGGALSSEGDVTWDKRQHLERPEAENVEVCPSRLELETVSRSRQVAACVARVRLMQRCVPA